MKVILNECTNTNTYILGSRTCYKSMDKSNETTDKQLVKNLLKSGHHSVFEHGFASFQISEVSLNCTHQLVRHRLLSFSQRSGRYVELDNDVKSSKDISKYFSIPEAILNSEHRENYENQIMIMVNTYRNLIRSGIKKEDARSILPQSMFTEITASGNFREWLHVINMRVSKGAQWEIRNLCIEIWKQLYSKHPLVFGIDYFEGISKDLEYKKEIFETHIV